MENRRAAITGSRGIAVLSMVLLLGCGDGDDDPLLRATYDGTEVCQGGTDVGVVDVSTTLVGPVTFTIWDDGGDAVASGTETGPGAGSLSFAATCAPDATQAFYFVQVSSDSASPVRITVPCVPCGDAGPPFDSGMDSGPMDGGVGDAPLGDDGGVVEPRMVNPVAISGVLDDGQLYVLDERLFALFGFPVPTAEASISTPTVTSGSHDIVWGEGEITGEGPELMEPADSARVDADTTLVLDSSTNTLLNIGHADGLRTIVSGAGVGSGPEIDAAHSVVYDARSSLAYIAMHPFRGMSSILSVNLSTGERLEIWRAPDGRACAALELHPEGNRLFTFCNNDLTAIDLDTAEQTTLAEFESGPGLPEYEAMQIDHTTNRLAMISNGFAAFSFLDLGTGEVLVVSSPDRGEGPELIRLRDLLYFATGRIFVVDSVHAAVIEIAENGDREFRTMLE